MQRNPGGWLFDQNREEPVRKMQQLKRRGQIRAMSDGVQVPGAIWGVVHVHLQQKYLKKKKQKNQRQGHSSQPTWEPRREGVVWAESMAVWTKEMIKGGGAPKGSHGINLFPSCV